MWPRPAAAPAAGAPETVRLAPGRGGGRRRRRRRGRRGRSVSTGLAERHGDEQQTALDPQLAAQQPLSGLAGRRRDRRAVGKYDAAVAGADEAAATLGVHRTSAMSL